jgi:TonB family protein
VVITAILSALIVAQSTPSSASAPCQQDVGVVKSVTPHGFGKVDTESPVSTTIAVVVSPDGKIEKAIVYKPSGDAAFDKASLQGARATVYRPKIVDCTPVSSIYYFKATSAPPQ